MPGPGRPAIEKSGTPVQTGTNGGCTGLNPIADRQRRQSGTPVQGKADPIVKPGIGGQGLGVGDGAKTQHLLKKTELRSTNTAPHPSTLLRALVKRGSGAGGRGLGRSGENTKAKKPGIRGQGPGVREKRGSRKKRKATPLETLIKNYLSRQSFSEATLRGYRQRLERFLAFLKNAGARTPREITKAHINEYAASMEGLSDATRAAYLATLKTFFNRLASENLILGNPASFLRIPHVPALGPMPLTEKEMVRLLDAPDVGTILGLRDRAILETLYGTGMRVSELLALHLQDVNLADRTCFIRKGKGGKGRWAPLTEQACRFLGAYMERARSKLAAAKPTAHLFLCLSGKRLGEHNVRLICRRHAKRAGIVRPVWAHLLRHTAACHLLENGASLFHVQMFLGHALASTTERYTHVTRRHMMEAYRCHPRA